MPPIFEYISQLYWLDMLWLGLAALVLATVIFYVNDRCYVGPFEVALGCLGVGLLLVGFGATFWWTKEVFLVMPADSAVNIIWGIFRLAFAVGVIIVFIALVAAVVGAICLLGEGLRYLEDLMKRKPKNNKP